MDEICRFCARPCTTLENIFGKSGTRDNELILILESCAELKLRESDSLPQNICGPCISSAKNAYEFKLRCEHSETYFKKLHRKCDESKVKCNMDEVCRFCTINCAVLEKIFPESEQTEPLLISMLEHCTNCLIREWDSLPQNICGPCIAAAKTSYEFKLKCEQSEKYFMELLSEEQKPAMDELTIEEYVITEYWQEEQDDDVEDEFDKSEGLETTAAVDDNSENSDGIISNETAESSTCQLSNSEFMVCSCQHMEQAHVPKTHICTTCSKGFASKLSLKAHMRCHSEERPFECTDCPKTFRTKSKLKSHMTTHTRERLSKCEHCGKAFKNKSHLREHVLIHSEDRPYKCEDCLKMFRSKSALKKHTLMHSGFKCEHCTKGFKLFATLQAHIKLHTEERLFECEVCHKKFRTNIDVKRHMRFHSEERPFKCDQCSKAFKYKPILNRHILTHSEERLFPCQQCSKTFTTAAYLKKHIITHSEERLFPCQQCSKSFTTAAYLKRHIATH